VFDEEITTWLNSIKERPAIKAINIGLFEESGGYCAYLVGSNSYDENDDDWACNEDFIPTNKYVKLLNSNSMNWEKVQERVISSIQSYILNTQESSVLKNIEVITVGFDDAELERVK